MEVWGAHYRLTWGTKNHPFVTPGVLLVSPFGRGPPGRCGLPGGPSCARPMPVGQALERSPGGKRPRHHVTNEVGSR